MPSALGPRGSTTRWRRIRSWVLSRDGYVCQAPLENGMPCGAYATVAGHITPRALWPPGQPGIDGGMNLRAECARHSNHGGSALGHSRRRELVAKGRAVEAAGYAEWVAGYTRSALAEEPERRPSTEINGGVRLALTDPSAAAPAPPVLDVLVEPDPIDEEPQVW